MWVGNRIPNGLLQFDEVSYFWMLDVLGGIIFEQPSAVGLEFLKNKRKHYERDTLSIRYPAAQSFPCIIK